MPRVLPDPTVIPTSLLVDFQAKHNGDLDYAVLVPCTTSAVTSPGALKTHEQNQHLHVTWSRFASAVHRGAYLVNPLNATGRPTKGRSVVGFIVAVDTIVYQTVLVAVQRSGAIVSRSLAAPLHLAN